MGSTPGGGEGEARRRAVRRVALAAGVAIVAVGCASADEPVPSAFRVGMSRAMLVAEFGEPESRRSLVKSQEHVWGPIEDFWSSLPDGARVEIWRYPAAGGTVELYFVDGSPRVQGTGFAPEGAVF